MGNREKILIIGDLILDQYYNVVTITHKEQPNYSIIYECNPSIKNNLISSLGGAGNVASNVAALSADAILISTVGRDAHATRLKELLHEHNITADLIEDSDYVTTVKKRIRCLNPQKNEKSSFRLDIEKRNPCIPESVVKEKVDLQINKGVKAIIIADYGKGMFCDKKIAPMICNIGNDNNIPVLVDTKQTDFQKYKGASLLKPNQSEFDNMTEFDTDLYGIEHAINKCRNELINNSKIARILLTREKNGMIYITENFHKEYSPLSHTVVDSNGAGDTVLAVIAVGITHKLSYDEAVKISNCVAGIVIQKEGTNTVSIGELKAVCDNCREECSLIDKLSFKKRHHVRKTLDLKADTIYKGRKFAVHIKNLSEGGIFMITNPSKVPTFSSTDAFDLTLCLSSEHNFNLNCKIIWSSELSHNGLETSYGINLINPPISYKEFVKNLM